MFNLEFFSDEGMKRPYWGRSRKGLNIRMFSNEPAEDIEGVAEHKKEVDELIDQGTRYEKFTKKDQRGDGSPHGGFQRWAGRDVLSYGGTISIGEIFPGRVFCKVRVPKVI